MSDFVAKCIYEHGDNGVSGFSVGLGISLEVGLGVGDGVGQHVYVFVCNCKFQLFDKSFGSFHRNTRDLATPEIETSTIKCRENVIFHRVRSRQISGVSMETANL